MMPMPSSAGQISLLISFICHSWWLSRRSGLGVDHDVMASFRVVEQNAQPSMEAATKRVATLTYASSPSRAPSAQIASCSMPTPISSYEMTLRSSGVYSSPVCGFSASSTCAYSLYVIASAASMLPSSSPTMSNCCWTSSTSLPGRGRPWPCRRRPRTRCRSPSCRSCALEVLGAGDACGGERHLERAGALEDLGDVGDVRACLARCERLGHPGDREVGLAVGQHRLRHDVAALEDLDVEAGVLVEALARPRRVAGELGSGRTTAAAASRLDGWSTSPAAAVPSGSVPPPRVTPPGAGGAGRAARWSRAPANGGRASASGLSSGSDMKRFLMWSLFIRGPCAPVLVDQDLHGRGDQVEHQTEQATPDTYAQARRSRIRQRRGDPRPSPFCEPPKYSATKP